MPDERPTKERPAVKINNKLNEDKLDNDGLDDAIMHGLMDQVKGRVEGAAGRAAVSAGNCRRSHYIRGNGNCQFRAIAAQHLGDQERWHQIRAQACQHIRNNLHNANYAAQAVPNYLSLEAWCINMEQPSTWGNELSLLAAARALDIRILVFSESHNGQMHRFYPEAGAKPTIFLHLVDMHYKLNTTCGPSPPSPPPPSPPLCPSAGPARASRTSLPPLPTLLADIKQRVRTEMHDQAQTFRCLTPKHAISRAAESHAIDTVCASLQTGQTARSAVLLKDIPAKDAQGGSYGLFSKAAGPGPALLQHLYALIDGESSLASAEMPSKLTAASALQSFLNLWAWSLH